MSISILTKRLILPVAAGVIALGAAAAFAADKKESGG